MTPRHLLSLLLLSLPAAAAHAQDDQIQIQIKSLLDKYTLSINRADTTLAAEVWSTTPDVSLIHPMGHERGWNQIKDNFYTSVMGKMFSHRDLKAKDITIHLLGDAAWLEFNWEFTATLAATNQPMNSKGRESQFLQKTPQGWRLLHVHYSIPFTPPAQAP